MFNQNLLELSHTVTKIETLAVNGTPISTGTGFFYNMELDTRNVALLVTNRHVVELSHFKDDKCSLRIKFARSTEDGSRASGEGIDVTIPHDRLIIFYHPEPDVDLAAIPLDPVLNTPQNVGFPMMHVCTLDKDMLPPDHVVSALHAGSKTLMIGHPRGLIDEANNFPIVRSGVLATPFHADFNGERQFLVDMATFPGSSGSPVLAVFDGIHPTVDGQPIFNGNLKFWLIGILWGAGLYNLDGKITIDKIPNQFSVSTTTEFPMGIGYCLKSNRLEELKPLIEGWFS